MRASLRRALQCSVALSAAWAAGCFSGSSSATGPQQEEELYFTRNRVELLASLEPDAPVAAVLAFDTRATILASHRSYVQIRTADLREGWVPRSMLLDTALRRQLQRLTNQSAALPDQGRAHARDTLNVHVEPYRWAPTFYQLEQDEAFELLDRTLVERLPASARSARVRPEPTGLDHWLLVRLPEIRQTGWLLENMAYAGIPLEVAMLAQGRPIVGYFAIGSIVDESLGTAKTTWLWVQCARGKQVHDFDRLMVFQWDRRRDRYVVIRQDTRITGYLPVEMLPEFDTPHGSGMGFRILVEKSGRLHTRTYVYAKNRVYRLGDEPVQGVPRFLPAGGFGVHYGQSGSVLR